MTGLCPLDASGDAVSAHGRSAERVVRSIVSQLEEDIVLGYLLPRERLVEDALIERFQAKRYAVREALAELERMGLVERQPNRGAAVRALTPAEADDIYAVREILEVAAARLVIAAATPEFITHVIKVQRRHDEAARAGDPKAAFRANIEFHRAFFSGCGNDQLAEAIEQFGRKAHRIRSFSITRQEYLERARDEHWVMIRALQERDVERLITMCRDHIQVAKDAYIDAYQRLFPEKRTAKR